MAHTPSDPWQDLLDDFRQQTGIRPVPLSAAEKQSGLLEAFSAAVAPDGQPPSSPEPPHRTRPQRGPDRRMAPASGEARQAALRRIREAMAEQRPTEGRPQPTERPRDPAPISPPPPVTEGPVLPPKRTAMHLAAYKKTGR